MALSEAKQAEIERACMRLAADYAYFLDGGRLDEWAALFMEDAEFGQKGQTHRGRGAIRASLNLPENFIGMHVFSNVRIEAISEDEARGSIYVAVYAATGINGVASVTNIEPFFLGAYDDVYRKTPEGWRFAKRVYAPVFLKAQR